MKADAVIFDKDGTLLDFDAFWVTVSKNALAEVLTHFEKQEVPVSEILTALGVHNGITDIDGILCKGTYAQMGQIVSDILQKYGCTASCEEITRFVIDAYNRHSDSGEIRPTCPTLADTLLQLKKRGKKLAVVTTDNDTITLPCLQKLGIDTLFDQIYTDDGKTPTKPDPYCAADFGRITQTTPEHLVMVGDTMTDITFAKNAGIPVIALAKTEHSKAILAPFADAVISDLSALLTLLE